MQKKEFNLLSGRGVINIDFLIAYSLFVIFMIFMISQVLSLITPFKDFITFQAKEKKIEITYEKLKKSVYPYTEAVYACNHSLPYFSDFYFSYNVLGFNMPYTDPKISNVNTTTNGEIHFIRDSYNLQVLIGSNSTGYNLSFKVVFPENLIIKKSENYFESSDMMNKTTDKFYNKIFSVNLSISEGDLDELLFNITNEKSGLVLLADVVGIDEEKIFIGEVKKMQKCREITGEKTKIEFFSSLSHKDSVLPIKVKMGGR